LTVPADVPCIPGPGPPAGRAIPSSLKSGPLVDPFPLTRWQLRQFPRALSKRAFPRPGSDCVCPNKMPGAITTTKPAIAKLRMVIPLREFEF
jgi:hypothetical protein